MSTKNVEQKEYNIQKYTQTLQNIWNICWEHKKVILGIITTVVGVGIGGDKLQKHFTERAKIIAIQESCLPKNFSYTRGKIEPRTQKIWDFTQEQGWEKCPNTFSYRVWEDQNILSSLWIPITIDGKEGTQTRIAREQFHDFCVEDKVEDSMAFSKPSREKIQQMQKNGQTVQNCEYFNEPRGRKARLLSTHFYQNDMNHLDVYKRKEIQIFLEKYGFYTESARWYGDAETKSALATMNTQIAFPDFREYEQGPRSRWLAMKETFENVRRIGISSENIDYYSQNNIRSAYIDMEGIQGKNRSMLSFQERKEVQKKLNQLQIPITVDGNAWRKTTLAVGIYQKYCMKPDEYRPWVLYETTLKSLHRAVKNGTTLKDCVEQHKQKEKTNHS